MNILLVTLDQFRGDALSCAGHAFVKTPNLDLLAEDGVRLARHYSQAAPCGPGRASLYTGLYQMNHRVVANGTPLDARFDTVAKAARRAGYVPALFGYTDQAIDPRETNGPDDARLQSYEEVLPGFDAVVHLPMGNPKPWTDWLKAHGHALPDHPYDVLATEPGRPAEHSMAAFLTDKFLAWLGTREAPWFAHLSHLRPHSPYAAAGRFSTLYDPDAVTLPVAPARERHWLHDDLLAHRATVAPKDEGALRAMMAQYFGMVSEADFQLGRVWAALKASGQWNETFVVVTSDHGDMLGDHGLIQKSGFFEAAYRIPGFVRDPRLRIPRVVEAFTENVDILPTLCEAMGVAAPAQCDGVALTPFIRGETPPAWRDAAHWQFDWRARALRRGPHDAASERRLERDNLTVLCDEAVAYVQFADGDALCFDLKTDPTWRTPVHDKAHVLDAAQRMLAWRARHQERTLTGMLVEKGGVGRWPAMPEGWG